MKAYVAFGPLSTAIRSGEEPVLSSEGDAAEDAFGGVVGEADPAVVEEAAEGRPALEHVIDNLWRYRFDGKAWRARRTQPNLELSDERYRSRACQPERGKSSRSMSSRA
jgi:hypothetical protein